MMPNTQLRLLWHTVRHLRPIQVGARLWFRLYRPKVSTKPLPVFREAQFVWTRPSTRRQSQFGPNTFRFIGADGTLSDGWDDERREKLWRYNLHYFDDLNARGASERIGWHEKLIERWVKENRPGSGTGWEPYPTSLRIVNWIKWVLAGNRLPETAVSSLATQARWLSRRLEYHLLGNHLFANAKALVFAGVFFGGSEAESWLAKGCKILRTQLPEQILPDGGHFELSTMYHALALEDVLDLINLFGMFPQIRSADAQMLLTVLPAYAQAMRRWLASMSHPDGGFAFFNDAAFGVAPSPQELNAYADRLGLGQQQIQTGTILLPDTGYIRLNAGPCVALIDAARIGPDYQPGHAHADTLSFELSFGTKRLLVNTGTSAYGSGAERLRQRGTAAHNTVVVAGENSSEVWAGFRVARRAFPFGLRVEDQGGGTVVTCSHDGYMRLEGKPVHQRILEFGPAGATVLDSVKGGSHAAEARFHFHPDWTIATVGDGKCGTATIADGQFVKWEVECGEPRLDKSSYHPEFGVALPATCLAVNLSSGRSRVRFIW
ncbi:heparinase II/III family protein [Mesorhizobium sp. M0923]|uniref:heparinase II/III family protein n=1 Tax=Mesorhizobium sp. M0923 TaxID=2957028 RepID=UPI00333AE9FA